jgi:hypothetical protein
MPIDPNEYGTPRWLIALASRVIAPRDFTLDAFSSAWHAERLGMPRYFDAQRSALDVDWNDGNQKGVHNVWANPPYSAGLLGACVARWMHAVRIGWCQHAFLLVPATPSTRWAQEVMQWPHCLLARRVAHHHPTLDPSATLKGTRHDSMVVYAGPATPRFREVFTPHGLVR